MSATESKTWLVAYDIREPRRLRRVHRYLKKQGMPAQYSAFTVDAHDGQIAAILHALSGIIDIRADDVRAYHLPVQCPVWKLGAQDWPDGVYLPATQAARLLTVTDAEVSDGPEVTELEEG